MLSQGDLKAGKGEFKNQVRHMLSQDLPPPFLYFNFLCLSKYYAEISHLMLPQLFFGF